MNDLGELKYFLGIEFLRSQKGILMCQRKYALELVSELGLAEGKPAYTPLEFNQKLTSVEFDQVVKDSDSEDWEACVESSRSVTGYVVNFGYALISWKSKK
ncbi:uncharacterized mitochondrial protein AtMg00810-like [Nicotiana sylvestris]|uniref:uncharacterized mitochondrial protein AtMg00810-like n=1 Tax=Nicotiana sylvestris TaxID=4096 RepID=UPI00388CCDDB